MIFLALAQVVTINQVTQKITEQGSRMLPALGEWEHPSRTSFWARICVQVVHFSGVSFWGFLTRSPNDQVSPGDTLPQAESHCTGAMMGNGTRSY